MAAWVEETRRDLDQDVKQLEQMVVDLDQAQKMCAQCPACRDRQVAAMQQELERLQRVRGVVAEQVAVRTKWCQLLQPHREVLNQAMSSLERASGECSRLTESLEAKEVQRDRHRSEIESIKLEMSSLEAQKKLAVSSRSFKEAGRVSEQMRAREEERRAPEEQSEELQSSLLTSREVLVASRQAEEAAQAELLRVETDCAMEGNRVLQQQFVDVVALRKRMGDATGERALLEMEERNLRAAQVHLAAKHGLMLAPAVEDIQEPEQEVSDVPSEALEAAVEQAPALEAELDEASGDGETVRVVPALDVEAARVRIAEPERVQAVEESFQEAVEADVEEACEGGEGGSGGDMPVRVTVLNSLGRNGAAGVVLGGDRPKVMLALVEEPNAETEDWVWDSGAALYVASATVAGKREVSFFVPLILSASDVVNSVKSVVVKMAEIGDTVRAAVLPNIPMRCARAGVAHRRVLAFDGGRG